MQKLMLLLPILLFCSCEDDMIWDFINPAIEFSVTYPDGNDLLDPSTEGCILSHGITVTHRGEVYSYGLSPRANPALPWALRLDYHYWEDKYVLSFGEFKPDGKAWKQEELVVDWGDGTRDTVVFDLYTTWKRKNPTVHKKLWINGKYQKGSFRVDLIKEHSKNGIRTIGTNYFYTPAEFRWKELEADKVHIFRSMNELKPFLGGGFLEKSVDFQKYDAVMARGMVSGWTERVDPKLYLYSGW